MTSVDTPIGMYTPVVWSFGAGGRGARVEGGVGCNAMGASDWPLMSGEYHKRRSVLIDNIVKSEARHLIWMPTYPAHNPIMCQP